VDGPPARWPPGHAAHDTDSEDHVVDGRHRLQLRQGQRQAVAQDRGREVAARAHRHPARQGRQQVAIHSSDIRRPLGAPPEIPGNRAEAILDFLAKNKAQGFVAKGRLDGLRFEATDVEWNSGNEGQLVRGPAEALILAISGRKVALDDLEGEGVATLRSRS
jgi:uncharacterized protein (TIGR03083 family)